MAEVGIDVLLCSDPANMNYLTGYDAWSFYVHQLIVVRLDLAEPIWIGRAMDAPGVSLTTYLEAARILPYDETYVDAPERHPMEHVSDVLLGSGFANKVVGVEADCWYFTARSATVLAACMPNARIVDAFGLVNRVRMVKSTAEINMMRTASAIADRAMAVGVSAVRPGQRECDVAAAVTAAQFAGVDGAFGDYPAALIQAPSGERTAAPHLTWSDARYGRKDVTYLEIAGCCRRYHAPLARTVCLGSPPDWLSRLVPVVEEGMVTALDAARAGAVCADVEAAWRAVIARAGYKKDSRIGYSIGIGYPPDWGERTANLRAGDQTVLAENMCFHVILGMWTGNAGYEVSESIRITASGPPEQLTRFPRDLSITA